MTRPFLKSPRLPAEEPERTIPVLPERLRGGARVSASSTLSYTLSASSRAGSSDNLVEPSVAIQTGTRGDRVELVQVTRNNPLLEPFKQIPRDTLSRLELEVRQGPSRATGKSDILSWD